MGKNSLQTQALGRLGKNWSKSSLTRTKLLSNTKELAKFVEKTFGLERIENLKPGHIEAYVQNLKERELSASTMADKMTAVREIAAAIGKRNIVERNNSAYGINRTRVNPQAVDREKIEQIRGAIEERAAAGERLAIMMVAAEALRDAFGLRAKESLMTAAVVVRDGKELLAVEGAKGGRPRLLPIDNDRKAAAVKLAQATSEMLGSGTGRIIPPEMSLKEAYDAQRNEWRALGGTRAHHANMHGQRHLHAREMSAGGARRTEIMADLGHGEDRSPSAYGVTVK